MDFYQAGQNPPDDRNTGGINKIEDITLFIYQAVKRKADINRKRNAIPRLQAKDGIATYER